MKDYPNARDCAHGHLRRACPICEAEARLAELQEAVRPVVKWWRKERVVADPPYLPSHVVMGTDGPEAVNAAQLDALDALVGEV
jgi:hypothetical protein